MYFQMVEAFKGSPALGRKPGHQGGDDSSDGSNLVLDHQGGRPWQLLEYFSPG